MFINTTTRCVGYELPRICFEILFVPDSKICFKTPEERSVSILAEVIAIPSCLAR
jgi:hypothetical protein